MYLKVDIDDKKYILFSDLHILHKNIEKYEEESRKKLYKKLNVNNNYDFWVEFLKQLPKWEIWNLWDFIFNINKDKFLKTIPILELYFNKIKGNLIIWNHFTWKHKYLNRLDFDRKWNIKWLEEINKRIENFTKYFNPKLVKAFNIIKNKNSIYIFTHYPLWSYLQWEINIELFKKIDKYLLEYIWKEFLNNKNINIINFHWHTHSRKFYKKLNNKILNKIKYKNVCVDYLINKT